MAEFCELVRIKKRLCAKYKCGFCNGCPLGKGENSLCGIISVNHYPDFQFKELEDELLSWAAKNPEPVYPTWEEWLVSIGVAQVGSGMLSIHPAISEKPIPADIAQKLGLKPKEG